MLLKILKLIVIVLLLVATITGVIVMLDTKSLVSLNRDTRIRIRQALYYCVDGGQVYRQGESFLPDGPCTICVCNPEQGGVSCTTNTTLKVCVPNPLNP